jgi:predicted RNA-binding Zn-ribbon protein involved in translation (DUF1610 family)
MTVHRIKEAIAFSCDECPETIETDERDFSDAWLRAQALGWRAHRNSEGQFEHQCPNCAEMINP